MAGRKESLLGLVNVFSIGALLGIVFLKTEVASWRRIHDMFTFSDSRMYLVMGTAICVAAGSLGMGRHFGLRSLEGKPFDYDPKPFHWGVILGGLLFGVGWALTGACPGPIYAQIGSGEGMAVVTMAGAMLGVYAYAWLKPRLPD
ncbi:MAG: YeeE/YedE family protein [Candidatus Eremiobacteraeota bacterium]|nr:YeeE/YedE family protein [Candidatus Eremiobacteraeota bacterium]